MEIYYINADKFLPFIDKNSLKEFLEDKTFGNQKRETEFCLGRFLVKYVLTHRYNIINPQIEIKNKKPCLKNNKENINFSISHSKGIVLAVFDTENTGADIEFMKPRNFDKLFDFYNLKPKSKDSQTFYQIWTQYEAEIKLQQKPVSSIQAKFLENYILSVCSSAVVDIKSTLRIYELTSPKASTNPSELINLKLVIESKKNENTLVAQEISTADSVLDRCVFLEPLNLKIE